MLIESTHLELDLLLDAPDDWLVTSVALISRLEQCRLLGVNLNKDFLPIVKALEIGQ